MSKTVVPFILSKLEPYLEALDIQYEAQVERKRLPTLPYTVDGKVNVREITLALGLRQSQEQHFYKKPELSSLINSIASIQGLKAIGSRAIADRADEVVSARLSRISHEKNDLARVLAEKEAEIETLRAEVSSLKAQIQFIETTGLFVR
jgi:hypothetical protein